jgi:hypothetical protein
VLKEPQPVQSPKPERDAKDDDAAWEKKERDYSPLEMSWSIANKKLDDDK